MDVGFVLDQVRLFPWAPVTQEQANSGAAAQT